MVVWKLLRHQAFAGRPLPDDFIPEIGGAENSIHDYFEIVAGRGVAVKIKAAGRFQDTVQLDQPDGHHGEVSHHVVLFEKRAYGPEHFGGVGVTALHHGVKGAFGAVVPVPGIPKSLDLGLRLFAGRRSEKDIVTGLTVEGRIKVNQVNAFVLNVLFQDVEIVAVVQMVHKTAVRRGFVSLL